VAVFIVEREEVRRVRGRLHGEDRDSMNLSCILNFRVLGKVNEIGGW